MPAFFVALNNTFLIISDCGGAGKQKIYSNFCVNFKNQIYLKSRTKFIMEGYYIGVLVVEFCILAVACCFLVIFGIIVYSLAILFGLYQIFSGPIKKFFHFILHIHWYFWAWIGLLLFENFTIVPIWGVKVAQYSAVIIFVIFYIYLFGIKPKHKNQNNRGKSQQQKDIHTQELIKQERQRHEQSLKEYRDRMNNK